MIRKLNRVLPIPADVLLDAAYNNKCQYSMYILIGYHYNYKGADVNNLQLLCTNYRIDIINDLVFGFT